MDGPSWALPPTPCVTMNEPQIHAGVNRVGRRPARHAYLWVYMFDLVGRENRVSGAAYHSLALGQGIFQDASQLLNRVGFPDKGGRTQFQPPFRFLGAIETGSHDDFGRRR